MVKDGKYSAMKFMKFFVNTLVHEKIPLIREACSTEVIYFLTYLKPEDINRVSCKLWDFFVGIIESSDDPQLIRGYVTKLYSLLDCEENL